jgi:putative transposase
MSTTQEPLERNNFYHVYNKTVGNEKMFSRNENYIFFLEKYKKYITPVADTYAWCLMPNHFHFLIRVKGEGKETLRGFETLVGLQFSHLFNSYAQAYNKQNNRSGSLFKNRFKRKKITDDYYLRQLVLYIHYNPIIHKLCDNINDWKFSSYPAIVNGEDGFLKRKEILEWFESKDNFIFCHNNRIELEDEFALEDN